MLCPSKFHPLDFELATDERKEINSGNDDVAAQHPCRFLSDSKTGAKPLENLRGKKGDLPLVIFAMIKVAVTEQTLACDTLDPFPLNQRRLSRWLAIMANEVVFR